MKILKILRIVNKVLLCICLIIAVSLLLNFLKNLTPTSDGFYVMDTVSQMIHGDGYWTWENLTTGLAVSFKIFIVLFCIDKVLDIIYCKKQVWER